MLNLNSAGQNYAYLYDGSGNVEVVLNSSQAVVAAYRYDPFGNLTAKTGSLNQPYGFSTKRYDAQTGLYDFGMRFYSPMMPRWMTRDPLGEAGGLNLYAFVGNNPVNWVDPWGLEAIMVDLTQNKLTLFDAWGNRIRSWGVLSGSPRHAAAPAGNYTLPNAPSAVPSAHPRQQSFCDPANNCWWQPITPTFQTTRTGLGVHPDGGVVGQTEGCLGVTDPDTSELFQWLQQYWQDVDWLRVLP